MSIYVELLLAGNIVTRQRHMPAKVGAQAMVSLWRRRFVLASRQFVSSVKTEAGSRFAAVRPIAQFAWMGQPFDPL